MAKKQQYLYNEHDQSQVQRVLQERKKKKRRKIKKRVFLVIILVLILAYFVMDISKIQSITIQGNRRISTEVLQEAAGIKEHKTLHLFQTTSAIKDNVKEVVGVKEVEVQKDIMGNIEIIIQETEVIAYSVMGEEMHLIDEKGEVSTLPILEMTEEIRRCPKILQMEVETLQTFAKEYDQIPSQVRNQISEIVFAPQSGDGNRCEFRMDDGKILYLRIDNMAKLLAGDRYAKVLRRYPEAKYYDFLGDDNVYASY